jgi:hypothetical protein
MENLAVFQWVQKQEKENDQREKLGVQMLK